MRRSLIVLKALTYRPTGGIVAAPTTSLPERIGGERNWDYRYCWLRDATFTLYALLNAGYTDRGAARGATGCCAPSAGDPAKAQILYGLGGQRRIPEQELDWLPGYAGSRPVRIGNAAHEQFQLDVYGEVMDVLHQARVHGLDPDDHAWSLQRNLLEFLEGAWDQPDEGIWEVRGARRHFTHSKVLAWVAFDRAVQAVERWGLQGPVDRWRAARGRRSTTRCCREGFNVELNSFTQSYGSDELDASTLLIPILGFLPPTTRAWSGRSRRSSATSPRTGSSSATRRASENAVDGLSGGEGAFLPCSFWLVDALVMLGRRDEARELFERLLGVQNDLGLLAGGVRPVREAAARQLPAGVHARRPRQLGVQPLEPRQPGDQRSRRG